MSAWYVRPDSSHNTTRNGNSYETAWGGWAAIVWGGAGVVPGDVLYVCGVHSITSPIAVGNHGATISNRVVVSGAYGPSPGSIIVTSPGGVFLQIARSYTTLSDIRIVGKTSYCVYFYAAAPIAGVTVQSCTLNGGIGAPIINIAETNGLSHSALTITDNDFVGGSGSSLGSAINWLAPAAGSPLTTLDRVTITNNRFTGCSSSRAVIHLRAEDGANAGAKMSDIIVTGNTFTDCSAVAMEIYGPAIYGRNTGIRAYGNKIYNQKSVGTLGGGMAIGGFAPSLTSDFGPNIISANEGYGLAGITGMVNVFYGMYTVSNNYAEDLTTDTIDGNGVLFDHGTIDSVAYGNEFRRLYGKEGVAYSGCGIMVLDSTNVRAYGNLIENCRTGIHLGNKLFGQSSSLYNNTFINCSMTGIDVSSAANLTANLIRNNLFTTTNSSVPTVRLASGTLTGESNNLFHGFGAGIGYSLHASDISVDPLLDTNYRPQADAVKRSGIYLGGTDFYGKQFYNPPNIGAVDDVTSTPLHLLTGG